MHTILSSDVMEIGKQVNGGISVIARLKCPFMELVVFVQRPKLVVYSRFITFEQKKCFIVRCFELRRSVLNQNFEILTSRWFKRKYKHESCSGQCGQCIECQIKK